MTAIIESEKTAVRNALFLHLNGIVIAPVMKALADRDILTMLMEGAMFQDIVTRTHANPGYLRVALRLLLSQGWAARKVTADSELYTLTPEGSAAAGITSIYAETVSFIRKASFLDDVLFGGSDEAAVAPLKNIIQRARQRWGLKPDNALQEKVYAEAVQHLDGMIVGPCMVALAREGVFELFDEMPEGVDPSNLMGNPFGLEAVFDLLKLQGWVTRKNNLVQLTPAGRYATQIAPSYGVTVSYLPMLDALSTLLFGNPETPRVDKSGEELLVNRVVNVWGSGGAHATYFRKIDDIIIDLFNRPLEQQPFGVCDVGCGDGALLEHIYNVVKTRTLRGTMLDTYPLTVVGADFNKVARRITKLRLRKAGIPGFEVIKGDINRPAYLASELENLGLDTHNFLHVRSFLDHNRPYAPPANYEPESRKARTTGAFALMGAEIPPDELEENLVLHFRRWAPYVARFGLIVLELHTLTPHVIAANTGKTPALAYDATFGFSDQYPVELDVFLACAYEAGLVADVRFHARIPKSELATISINFFKSLST